MSIEKKRGRGRPSTDAGMTARLALRMLGDDGAQLDALTERLGFDQPTVARAALRLGMTLLEMDPALLLAGGGDQRKRRQALKAHFERGGS